MSDSEPLPDADGIYTLYAIRNWKTKRLLTVLAATTLTGDADDRPRTGNRYLEVDGAMQIGDWINRNPIFVCHDRQYVENLIKTGCANEFHNHIVMEQNPELELVVIRGSIVSVEQFKSEASDDLEN